MVDALLIRKDILKFVVEFLEVFGPSLMDKFCCSVACFAVFCCCESVSLSHHSQFFFLLSPGPVGRNQLPVSAAKLAPLLDKLVEPVAACQRPRDFLDHRDCDRSLMFPRYVWAGVLCVGSSVVGPRC